MSAMITRLGRYYHTLKYLKPTQVYHQIFYKLKYGILKRNDTIPRRMETRAVDLKLFAHPLIEFNNSINGNCFTFLNEKKCFSGNIDWDWNGNGKLWTYNLNYFDFIHSQAITIVEKLQLIHAYIDSFNDLQTAKEPYPASLRNINLIKFLCVNNITDPKTNGFLGDTYRLLARRLEFHILGNHLLENAFSLYIGGCFLHDHQLLRRAEALLRHELEEQILDDGAHFELTPSYQKILLWRLLDCINATDPAAAPVFSNYLRGKASAMISWLLNVTFSTGEVPAVNDTGHTQFPTVAQLQNYARVLEVPVSQTIALGSSGYRMRRTEAYEIFIDIGDIAADYIPAHTHADIFSFVLYAGQKPLIVDPGVSTYADNSVRHRERATCYHNTVSIGQVNQSDVWSAFRVGKRAKVSDVHEDERHIQASHNGYAHNFGAVHTRRFTCLAREVIIEDSVGPDAPTAQFHLHFHPDVKVHVRAGGIDAGGYAIDFVNAISIDLERYEYAVDYNRLEPSDKVVVSFKDTLHTRFKLELL